VPVQSNAKKVKLAIMNAVHDLPVLVARDEGYFKDEGLDIEFVTTPGMGQVTTSHKVVFETIFDRPLDAVYNEGGIDQYRMCEWGIMKRAVEANKENRRHRKIVALGAAMSSFAIVVRGDSDAYEPEQLKDKPIAVETGGLLKPEELQTWRLLNGPVTPYTRERFEDTYNWTVKWHMTVPGATYENTVDNRAWQ
jgi:hypothetical protein